MTAREPWCDAREIRDSPEFGTLAKLCCAERDSVGLPEAQQALERIMLALDAGTVERRAADALADACDAAVRSGYIGSRSEVADALLGYRDVLADTRAGNSQKEPSDA